MTDSANFPTALARHQRDPAGPTPFVDDQDDVAFDRSMRALLHPRSFALVGASPNRGFANSIQRRLIACGYEGQVYPVNPNYPIILGLPTHPDLESIPEPIDVAVIVVPSRMVMDVLAGCERKVVGAVNIITSGFGEKLEDDTGVARQHAIRDFARRTGIRVVGPNCLGNISVPNRMVATSGAYPRLHSGPISLALQSGLLAYSLVIPSHDRGIGYRYIVTLGNEADVDICDLVRYYVHDDETRVIGCFVEQFRRPERLLALADEAADRNKPIVVLKIGRSDAGRRAALAHTGSIVGADDVADAVMRQHGIVRVDTLEEMTETLALFNSRKLPKGNGVAIGVVSGGAAGLISDHGDALGVEFPALLPETAARLATVVPSFGTVGNPLDYTGQAAQQPEMLDGCFSALAEDPGLDVIVYVQAYPALIDVDQPAGRILAALPDRYPDKVFVVASLVTGNLRSRNLDFPDTSPIASIGAIPFLQGIENSLKAIRALVRYGEYQRERVSNAAPRPRESPAAPRAREVIRLAGGKSLVEREVRAILAMYGIPTTRERLARSADEAVVAAREVGYPVALKIESPDILHKTEAGGVLLQLENDEAVRDGFQHIVGNARQHDDSADIRGVLVQEMVAAIGAREMILGMHRDPAFGPAIAVGLGGVFVETLKDVAIGVPPLTPLDAHKLLRKLRAAPVLFGSGSRGLGSVDIPAVVDVICRFSALCMDLAEHVREIEINPLVVFPMGRGVKVVDCLIVPSNRA